MTTSAHRGHLVLVGLMGVGKTTVGKAVAAALGRPFRDSDAEVEARTGHTVRELFEGPGEPAFRREETEALVALLADGRPTVIAAAGGVVLDPTNRRLLRTASAGDGLVAWLRADPAVLTGRVAGGSHRPLLADDPSGTLAEMAAVRESLYAEVADVEVNADQAVEAVVADLVGLVDGSSGSAPTGAASTRGAAGGAS